LKGEFDGLSKDTLQKAATEISKRFSIKSKGEIASAKNLSDLLSNTDYTIPEVVQTTTRKK